MTSIVSTLATIWRLAAPYFRSEEKWAARSLLAALVAIELAIVGITVLINQWNARFFNALQDRNWDNFISELMIFSALATVYIVIAVYQLYLNQWLQIRWRRWLTRHFLDRWLVNANHYRMQLSGDAADNPDQRIAEDIKQFIDAGSTGVGILPIGLGLLNSAVTLVSFTVILWSLSDTAPLHLFGTTWNIPGYLFWAALVYALIGTALTHRIGKPLIALSFRQQQFEADFRFNLVRVRENSEQVALLTGERAETKRLLTRFERLTDNWFAIMSRQKKLTFLTAGYSQASVVFPYIVVGPAYFAGAMQLGGLTQTGSAFNSVQGALSFFINVYRQIAEWRAVVDRLSGFVTSIKAAEAQQTATALSMTVRSGTPAIAINDLTVRLPNGTPLISASHVAIAPGDWVLVTGTSGIGKSTLFRAIAGIWPFGAGTIEIPKGRSIMMLPQRPYFPIATLANAVAYPADPATFGQDEIEDAIRAVNLPSLLAHGEDEIHWNRILSLGEQQRLGIARALLLKPDFLFLDEATASLDETSEIAAYQLLRDRLPNTTVVSIGHRATLVPLHRRRLVATPNGASASVLTEATN